MAGILEDNPNAEPPIVPWGPFSSIPYWYHRVPKRNKRTGRPGKLYLLAKFALAWCRIGKGGTEKAYAEVAEQHYGAVNPDPDAPEYADVRKYDKAVDKHERAIASGKRQIARERKLAKKLEAWDRAKTRGGILGK